MIMQGKIGGCAHLFADAWLHLFDGLPEQKDWSFERPIQCLFVRAIVAYNSESPKEIGLPSPPPRPAKQNTSDHVSVWVKKVKRS